MKVLNKKSKTSKLSAVVTAALTGAQQSEPSTQPEGNECSTEYRDPKTLLNEANRYFSDLKRKEKAITAEAHRRLQEMKNVNAKGGDSQGFKYVLPKNVKSLARRLQADTLGVADRLKHSYEGDEVTLVNEDEDIDSKPAHRKKRKPFERSDFYQFQVWQKWTHNAEKFLSRGRNGKRALATKDSGVSRVTRGSRKL